MVLSHHKVPEPYRDHTAREWGVHRTESKRGAPLVPPLQERRAPEVVAGPGAPMVKGPVGSKKPEEVADRVHAEVPGPWYPAPMGQLEGYSSRGRPLERRGISGYRSEEAASNHQEIPQV